jgi:TldD protein
VRKAAERAVANSRPDTSSSNPVQVGRYDVVFGGNAVVALVRTPLAEALNVERALGYRANREGTSFAAPPADILGKYQVGSPLVTLRADRTRPHGWTTVGWDDEGVAAGEHTLIKDGVIVDYLTTRQTAAELAMLRRGGGGGGGGGEAVRSRGCATGVGQEWPEAGIPNLTLVPGKEAVSVDDIIADTKRGYYVPDVYTYDGADQQLLSGQFPGDGVREIRNGKLGRSVTHFAFQFITPQFWKKLDALGGPASMGEEWPVAARLPYREDPLRLRQDGLPHIWGSALSVPFVSVRAVPARVREVNVLNTGATQ